MLIEVLDVCIAESEHELVRASSTRKRERDESATCPKIDAGKIDVDLHLPLPTTTRSNIACIVI